jgi:hypothetical protein
MPNFKPKNCKKLIVDESKNETVASKHKEFQNTFYENESVLIPKINSEIKELEKELENKDISIDKKIEIEDNIEVLKKEKASYKNFKKEYYLDNIQHIFSYFEAKKNISRRVPESLMIKLNL